MVRRLVLVATSVVLVVIGGGAPAGAQTKARADEVGDGPHTADIRSVRVQNNARKLAVTVRFTRVVTGRTAVAIITGRGIEEEDGPAAIVDVYPVSRGRFTARAFAFDPSQEEDDQVRRAPCASRDVVVRPGRRGFVRVMIARTCLPALTGRQETEPLAYDKRTIGGSITTDFEDLRSLRRGDAPTPDLGIPFDLGPTITTRRG